MEIQVKDIEDQPKEKVFHPFVVELKIKSEEDVLELLARFNLNNAQVNHELMLQRLPTIREVKNAVSNWCLLDRLYNTKPYMK